MTAPRKFPGPTDDASELSRPTPSASVRLNLFPQRFAMPIFYVRILLDGYVGEVFLNGAPISSSRGFQRTIVQVNHWLIPEMNRLEVRLDDAVGAARQEWERDPRIAPLRFLVELVAGEDGQPPLEQGGAVLARILWPTVAVTFPCQRGADFPFASPFPRWRWQDAEPLPSDWRPPADFLAFVGECHRILVDKDLAGLERLVDFTFAEVAPAYGYESDFARAEFRASYAEIFDDEEFGVAPLDPAQFDFRPICGRRLLELHTRQGTPLLRHDRYETEDGWFLPLSVGKWQGKWHALR